MRSIPDIRKIFSSFPPRYVNDIHGWAFNKKTIEENKGKLLTLDLDFGELCTLNCPSCVAVECNIWENGLEEIWQKSNNYSRRGVFNNKCIAKDGKNMPFQLYDEVLRQLKFKYLDNAEIWEKFVFWGRRNVMSIDKPMIIFWVVAFFGLLIYFSCQKLLEREPDTRSEKFNNHIGILLFVITLPIPLVIDIEKDVDAIIISVITYGVCPYAHNLFKIIERLETELKETNDGYKKILCNPAYAFKANKNFSETLQNQSYKVTNYYCKELETLEDRLRGNFPNSETVDRETAKLLLSISSKKAISALEQFSSGEMFLSTKFFTEFWKEAVKSSSSYLSICDLSMYSGKDEPQINSEQIDWVTRVEREIEALKNGKIKVFDKIILSESSQDGQNGSNNTIFNVVEDLWEKNVQKLKDLGIKSHCQSGNGTPLIRKFSRKDVSSWLNDINQSYQISGQINSYDLGIFGDHLIVEEFKVNEASTIIGKIKDSDINELKFLYRLSLQKALIKQIKKTIIEKMASQGTIN